MSTRRLATRHCCERCGPCGASSGVAPALCCGAVLLIGDRAQRHPACIVSAWLALPVVVCVGKSDSRASTAPRPETSAGAHIDCSAQCAVVVTSPRASRATVTDCAMHPSTLSVVPERGRSRPRSVLGASGSASMLGSSDSERLSDPPTRKRSPGASALFPYRNGVCACVCVCVRACVRVFECVLVLVALSCCCDCVVAPAGVTPCPDCV
jgi:hypothetical protein